MFEDRQDAGRRLARRLLYFESERPLVVGIPRGGVVVAYEVAATLRAPLDVIAVRELPIPEQPETPFGAIAPDGVRALDAAVAQEFHLSEAEVDAVAAREAPELRRQAARYRAERPPLDVLGRTVLLVAEGCEKAATIQAAAEWLRGARPRRTVLALPVVDHDAVPALRHEVDLLIALELDHAGNPGRTYREREPVSEERIVGLLKLAERWRSEPPAEVAKKHAP